MTARVSGAQSGGLAAAPQRGISVERICATWTLRGVTVVGEEVRADADVAREAALTLEIDRVGEDRIVAVAHVEEGNGRARIACVEAALGERAAWVRDEAHGMTHVDIAGLAHLSADADGGVGYAWTTLFERLGVSGGRSRLRGVALDPGE